MEVVAAAEEKSYLLESQSESAAERLHQDRRPSAHELEAVHRKQRRAEVGHEERPFGWRNKNNIISIAQNMQ